MHYPGRVYLFNSTSFEIIKPYGVVKSLQLLQQNCKWTNDNTFVVFAIDSSKLLDHHLFKEKKMVFYIDPCYNGNIAGIPMCEAIYTYSHIPRELITDKCFVYTFTNSANGKYHITLDDVKKFSNESILF